MSAGVAGGRNRRSLTILGASGYTGRLCAAEAVRRGLRVRLAGRRPQALEALAARFGGDITTATVDVTDAGALAALAESSDVLLTTVGPYQRLGRPVVEAALRAGCGYVDVCGEVPFLAEVHALHERAVAADVALVPGAGFDGVPGDLLAAVAAADLGGPADSARVAVHVDSLNVTSGTLRSALAVGATGGAAWVDGRLVTEALGSHRWDVPFPPPLGVRSAVSMPLAEVVTLGRSIGVASARAYVVTGPWLAVLAPLLARPAALVTRGVAATPLWELLDTVAERARTGPAEPLRAKTTAAVLVEVRGRGGTRRAVAEITDVYATAAVTAVVCARRMLEGRLPAGVATPSQATDPATVLDEIAVSWRLLD